MFMEFVGRNGHGREFIGEDGLVRVHHDGYTYLYDVGCINDDELEALAPWAREEITCAILAAFSDDYVYMQQGRWNGSFYINTIPSGDRVMECGVCIEDFIAPHNS